MAFVKKLKFKFLLSLVFAAIVFAILTMYADSSNLFLAFKKFSWHYLPVILLLVLVNYLLRFWKWDYYLKLLNIPVGKKDSFIIFMSGLIMAVTPGKFGEVLKAYLLKKINLTPIAKSSPIILAERVTDLLGLCAIAGVGAYSLHFGTRIVMATTLIIFGIVIVLGIEPLFLKITSLMERVKLVKKHVIRVERAYESASSLLALKKLFIPTIISILSWFCECLAFYLVLAGLGSNVSCFNAAFIYSFATIVGALSMLPGGIGTTETSMTGILIILKVLRPVAVAATFIIRTCTLWFAVVIGAIFFFTNHNKFGKLDDVIEKESIIQ
ncbi:MAG: hypothetical protein A2042_06970 [Candidatus Schekmanbacteria bacterium GWA2_38_11]|uniref:TIGR00374 family protein n=1 Tax=Candidatus Schekmanbacteria bacterium GWA2_38_11 TaxID=1817876 RepID=A0A1F7RL29_9BACT|nr:MAG: hypothetical protein A2042_06970 [Candidatus Schekmanbacteria bacterium GWA2_38_11]